MSKFFKVFFGEVVPGTSFFDDENGNSLTKQPTELEFDSGYANYSSGDKEFFDVRDIVFVKDDEDISNNAYRLLYWVKRDAPLTRSHVEISNRLKVSRTTVRKALLELMEKDLITKKHVLGRRSSKSIIQAKGG